MYIFPPLRGFSEETDVDLNVTVGNTAGNFELGPLLDTPTTDLVGKDGVSTKT